MLAAAPVARFIPLAALSAVLFKVAWRMGEWDNFTELWHAPKSDFWVMVASFGLTVVFDLTIAVGVGLVMSAALFVKRMEEITHVRLVTPESEISAFTPVAGFDIDPNLLFRTLTGVGAKKVRFREIQDAFWETKHVAPA